MFIWAILTIFLEYFLVLYPLPLCKSLIFRFIWLHCFSEKHWHIIYVNTLLTFCNWMRGGREFSPSHLCPVACCAPHSSNLEMKASETSFQWSLHPAATRKSSIHIPQPGSTQTHLLWNSPVNEAPMRFKCNKHESRRNQFDL